MEKTGIVEKLDALPPWKRLALAGALILCVSLCVYANSFRAGFHFDDHHMVLDNQNLRDVSNIPRFFTNPDMGSYTLGLKSYRPLTYISFTLNYAADGYRVRGYHMVNFAFHVTL